MESSEFQVLHGFGNECLDCVTTVSYARLSLLHTDEIYAGILKSLSIAFFSLSYAHSTSIKKCFQSVAGGYKFIAHTTTVVETRESEESQFGSHRNQVTSQLMVVNSNGPYGNQQEHIVFNYTVGDLVQSFKFYGLSHDLIVVQVIRYHVKTQNK